MPRPRANATRPRDGPADPRSRHLAGETIPIRLFLGGFELTPTFRDVNKKFSTRYYLNLVLIDEENRRYFKQQEITVYRQDTRDQVGAPPPADLGQHLETDRPDLVPDQ